MATWIKITELENIPQMGARKVLIDNKEIAIFKTKDGSIFALDNRCPHKRGKISEGLVHEHMVTCPLHNAELDLSTGETLGEKYTCVKTYGIKIEDNYIYLEI